MFYNCTNLILSNKSTSETQTSASNCNDAISKEQADATCTYLFTLHITETAIQAATESRLDTQSKIVFSNNCTNNII